MNEPISLFGLTILRPYWLLALPLLAVCWWRLRRVEMAERPRLPAIAPHLLSALTIGQDSGKNFQAARLLLLAAALMAVGAAGPAFRPAPSAFATETAPLIVALDLSPTMLEEDVPPSRLERAKQKIGDLITFRAGGRTGLIVYSGSAHLVMPPTDDPTVLQSFLEGLSPSIMPRPGQFPSTAMRLAGSMLDAETQAGSVLFVTDGVDPGDIAQFQSDGPNSVALVVASDGGGAELKRWADDADIATIGVTVDDGDLRAVNRATSSRLANAASADGRLQDDGWFMAIPAALLLLACFRRGTTVFWSIAIGLFLVAPDARAGPIEDVLLTPDQRGALAYADNDFRQASEVFEDARWRAAALIHAGRYDDAATILGPLHSSDAQYNLGIALIRGRDYPGAIRAFRTATELDPSNADARDNLQIALDIQDYLNDTRGSEDAGIENDDTAADDTVSDLDSGKGREARITGATAMSEDAADQWMKQVQTKPADFLRSRFAIEDAAGSGAEPR